MATNMVFTGVFLKFSKNADQKRKRPKQICHQNNDHLSCILASFDKIFNQFVVGPNKVGSLNVFFLWLTHDPKPKSPKNSKCWWKN